MTHIKTDLDSLRGHDSEDFPLSFRDRNWKLTCYSWDEKTGVGSFAYEHKFTGGKVEEQRYQGRYWLPEAVRAKLVPALPSFKSAKKVASQIPNGFHTKEAQHRYARDGRR